MAVVYLDERWPVLRGGERLPIDPYKRRLVYARDGYACQYCGLQVPPDDPAPGSVLQLDHIIPWSARGSDRSDNLRTLCGPCNEARSNFRLAYPVRVVGVAAYCYWCAVTSGRYDPYPQEELDEVSWAPAYCGHCGTASVVPSDGGWIL